ncbi:MAG: nucleoside triphosphate pyrophosphohydrolase [Actinobacteria bacterium]|nr:nucleoside triphosphate pyrophosphohydrolase [Actinomycetota bacterium]NBY15075.1 nucleoside triphosphate pyrophosphohydrolase [Actinomycetota bacterium]
MSESVTRLVAVMDQLRSPGGCPWDAEQTHESLARYLLEETYEVLEAMDHGDTAALREELGDLLLQVVFHARIAQEQDANFTLDAIADGVVNKLVRRHPHVFSDLQVTSQEELEENWAQIKRAEKQRESVIDGVPKALPALQLATQLLYRSRKLDIEFEDTHLTDSIAQLIGEVNQTTISELLVSVVQLARTQDLDPESCLRAAMADYRALVSKSEGLTQ